MRRSCWQTYRAQIEQCEKLKVELDLIHDAINRTKQEIAMLHGKSFDRRGNGAKITGELGAVVGGTEEATQQILEPPKRSNQAATALAKVTSPDQQRLLKRGESRSAWSRSSRRAISRTSPAPAHQQGDGDDEIHRNPYHRDDWISGVASMPSRRTPPARSTIASAMPAC